MVWALMSGFPIGGATSTAKGHVKVERSTTGPSAKARRRWNTKKHKGFGRPKDGPRKSRGGGQEDRVSAAGRIGQRTNHHGARIRSADPTAPIAGMAKGASLLRQQPPAYGPTHRPRGSCRGARRRAYDFRSTAPRCSGGQAGGGGTAQLHRVDVTGGARSKARFDKGRKPVADAYRQGPGSP